MSFINLTVLVSALGYFVDIYDLLLFGIVRTPSLRAIGIPESQLLETGVLLINMQMLGMLLGGILWGILGDKRGRVSVLFGSILIYSIANILNAFVTSIPIYCVLRFLAGLGLAGELGAAITLVSEQLSKEHRGLGTTFVATVGILGAVVAGIVGDLFSWKTAYLIGGFMGIALLLLRVSIQESKFFSSLPREARKGDLRVLLTSKTQFLKYLRSILIGVPIWYVVGILMTFAPEFAKELGVQGEITAGRAILFGYLGLSAGDLLSGYLSQTLKSRKKVVFAFLLFSLLLIHLYLVPWHLTPFLFYSICAFLGLGSGYWAVFMTMAAEQFGTNIRATVTTTVPNFVRGSVVVLTSSFQALKGSLGLQMSAWIVGIVVIFISFVALKNLDETFHKDLNYTD